MSDLHWRRKVVYLKKESTYGTDPTHADTDAMLTRNLTISPYQGTTVARANDKLHFGNDPQINVEPYVQVTFEVEIAGSGSAVDTPPAYAEALEGCGMVETITASTSVSYAPDVGDSANEFESVGIEFYLDGQMQQVLGCHGNVELVLNPNDYPLYRFTFQGIYAVPTAVSLPTPDVTDFATAIPITDTNTPTVSLHSESVVLHGCTINLGNVLAVRDLPNVGRNIIIADRAASGSITIEKPDLATKNWYTAIRSDDGHVSGALSIVHGTVGTNIVTIGAPAVQLSNPQLGDADGIATMAFDMQLLPSSGNDELSITCT